MTSKIIICLSIILAFLAQDVSCNHENNSDDTQTHLKIRFVHSPNQPHQTSKNNFNFLFSALDDQQQSEIQLENYELYFEIIFTTENQDSYLNVRPCSFEEETNRPTAGLIIINEKMLPKEFEQLNYQKVVYEMIHEFLQFFAFSRDLLKIEDNDLGIMEFEDTLRIKNKLKQILIKSNNLMKQSNDIMNPSDESSTKKEPWYVNIIKTEIIEPSFENKYWTPSYKTVYLLKGTGFWLLNENLVEKGGIKPDDQCLHDCNSHGICILGICHCYHKYQGKYCKSTNCKKKTPSVSNEVLNPDNVYRTTCPPGFYKDLYNRKCQFCDFSCSECSGPYESNCLACQQLTYLFESTCVYNCPDGLTPNIQTKKCEESSQQTNKTNIIQTQQDSIDDESGQMNNNSHSTTNNGRDSNSPNQSNSGKSGKINDNKPFTTNNGRDSELKVQSSSNSDEEQSLKIPKDCIQAILVKGKLGMQCIQCTYPLIVDDGKCVESCGERDWYSKCIQDFTY